MEEKKDRTRSLGDIRIMLPVTNELDGNVSYEFVNEMLFPTVRDAELWIRESNPAGGATFMIVRTVKTITVEVETVVKTRFRSE